MAFERIDRMETHEANADLSAKQFYVVKLLSTNKIDVADSAAVSYGVLQDKPKSGELGRVAPCGAGGLTKVISDGSGTAIAIGDYVKSGATGVVVKGVANLDRVIGMAKEASTANGTIITVDLAFARDISV